MTSYYEVLRELRAGQTIVELSEKLTEIVKAVRDTGKAGALTLTLKVKPASKGDEISALMLEEIVKAVTPEKDKSSTIFYANHENVLTRFDPRQPQLPGLKVVDMPQSKDLKEVSVG